MGELGDTVPGLLGAAAMGAALALVLPARGYQGGPDAVVAVRRPLPAARRRKGGG